ncbi:hypothetical protein SAMN02983003_1075 [Devosia enhydra]|uniref:Prophage tail length tape measure protein n=1 Tax=Devosia enhydra TaxID=665118 RepID=A0A1K2HV00_9HYPH|nr:hypothetical protein [Devosia enhydra]SFZ82434.1 hypothetical protein SAMN02983003_1075 [Devosia enhydra]
MADEGSAEKLAIDLEARVTDLEKGMVRAQAIANKAYAGLKKGSSSATRQMEADMARSTSFINNALASTSTRMGTFTRSGLGGMTAGFLGAVAPILSVTAALNTARAALSDFDRIGKNAKASGLGAEAFQELAYAAELGGVATETFAKSMEALNRNVGMAAVGKGELVEKLKQLNPQLLANIVATGSQEERLRLVADALEAESDASQKAAIATAVFGDAGVRMVEMLKGGSKALDDTADKARKLGIVVSSDLIARAEELNDEFTTATRVMDMQFKQVLIDLAPLLIGTAQLAGGLAWAIRQVVDAFKELDMKSTAGLAERQATIKDLLSRNAGTAAQVDSAGFIVPGSPMSVGIPAEQVAQLEAELAAIEAVLETRRKLDEARNAPLVVPPGGGGGGSVGGSSEDKAAQIIAALEAERAAIGLTAVEVEKLSVLRQAGADATDIQKQRIIELVQAINDEQAAAEIRASTEGPFEVMTAQLDELEGLLARGAISWDEYGQAAMRARAMAAGEALAMVGQITGAMTQLFEDNKALQLANVGVNTAAGVAKTLADYGGTPWGWAAVAGVVASGAAQAAAIMGARPGSSSAAGAAANTGAAVAAAPQQARQIGGTVVINGDSFGPSHIEGVINQITDMVNADGAANLVLAIERARR